MHIVVVVVIVVSVADTLAAAYKSIYFGFHDSWQELLLSFALIFVVRKRGCVKCSAALFHAVFIGILFNLQIQIFCKTSVV